MSLIFICSRAEDVVSVLQSFRETSYMLVQEFCIGTKTVKEKEAKGRNAPKVC